MDVGAQKKFNHKRAEYLQLLTSRSGVVFVSRAAPSRYDSLVMVPRDVRHIIHNGMRRDERTLDELSRGEDHTPTSGSVSGFRPNVSLDNTQNIPRDLAIFCAFILHHPVKVLNSGGIGRNDLKKISPLLSHNKTVKYVSWLALFAMSRKLLIPAGDRWRVSKGAGDWFRDSRRCYREMFEYWLNTTPDKRYPFTRHYQFRANNYSRQKTIKV